MRVLIFHGYLLGGTGSNVYNARLAEALVRLGHEVHLLCQERHPEEHAFVDAAGDWHGGALQVSELAARVHVPASRPQHQPERGHCTVYRPNIGGLLPVYVADRYEGIEARTFAQCSDAEIAHYIEANVAAVRELLDRVRPDVALANHLVMGPAILARALAAHPHVPYAVKVHGSALEYTVKPQPERFLGFAREGLRDARTVLVGSRHTALSLWRALAEEELPQRTRLGPPGVDVERFRPSEPAEASANLRELAARMRASARPPEHVAAASAFARDEREAAAALARLQPGRGQIVAFVGKLIVSKGVDLLIAAWPLVLAVAPHARLVIVGFGAYREGLEQLLDALAGGDLVAAREIALAGRALELAAVEDEWPAAEGDRPAAEEREAQRPLRHLLAFLDGLAGGERERYLQAAAALRERVLFSGRLEHEELAELLPACEALVVPSTFPEAFGMVAAEGAACGALPVSAAHSGLAEVSDELARAVPPKAAAWLSFPVDDRAIPALAGCLTGWLAADPALRAETRSGLVRTARERWSWEGVARGVIAAARGELEALREP